MQGPLDKATTALSPNEKITGILVLSVIATATWTLAGRASVSPYLYLPLALFAALSACLFARREGRPLNRLAFLPAAMLMGVIATSLINLAFQPLPENPSYLISRAQWLPWLPGTIDRGETWRAALPWIAALVLAGAIRQAEFGPRAVSLLWSALLVHGLVVAGVGTYFHFVNEHMVLGLYRDPYGYHFASFVYRNHWAAYAVLLMALSLGFAAAALRRWLRTHRNFDNMLPGVICALLLAITLPIPGSRSGMVMAGLLLGAALVLMVRSVLGAGRMTMRRRGLLLGVVVGMVAVVGVVGLAVNRPAVEKHWSRTLQQAQGVIHGSGSMRLNFTKDTLRIALKRPVWGWGVGSFARVFATYHGDYLRDEQGKPTARLLRAHNDWAQMWAEVGLLGLLVLLIPVGMRLREAWRDRRPLFRWGMAGVVLLLAYAWVDFPFQNPAVLFLWVTILSTLAPRSEAFHEL